MSEKAERSASSEFYRKNKHLGRNDLPAEFATDVLVGDLFDRLGEEYEEMLLSIWSSAEWPEQYVDTSIWEMLFKMGDSSRLIPDDTPDEMTLYRGAAKKRIYGMSWTTDLEIAQWFAGRLISLHGEGSASVYEVTVPKKLLLAKNEHRSEQEWVVDVSDHRLLKPTKHDN